MPWTVAPSAAYAAEVPINGHLLSVQQDVGGTCGSLAADVSPWYLNEIGGERELKGAARGGEQTCSLEEAVMGFVETRRGDLYYEEKGDGVPILLIHPAGATASTWGSVLEELAQLGRVVAYDRRGYSRSQADPVHSIPEHTADAAAILDTLRIPSAVVVGTSVGATIGIGLALRRPDLVRSVISYESQWRASRRRPTTSSLAALAAMGWLALRGRDADAAESFLRWAYTYRDGGTAWEAFPEQWRRAARANAKAVLADIRIAIGAYPPLKKLATITTPVICAHGTRSDPSIASITRSLARAIPTATVCEIERAGHAVAFDAPASFIKVIAQAIPS